MMTLSRKWALVTGTSPGGIGEATVTAFLTRGINVIATDISTQTTSHTQPTEQHHEGFLIKMALDVTSPSSIMKALEAVHQLTDGQLHFLVNNAGYGYFTPLLDADVDLARKQYDVNVWGVLAVTQAFFPLLRAGKGMVVNQASVAGVQGYNIPFMGIYSSSKAAVISLSDTMRVEFAPFGVKVVALLTSAVKTEFFHNQTGGLMSETSVYAPVKAMADARTGDHVPRSHDRWVVAKSTVDELLRERPSAYIRKGYLASFLCWVYWLLPTWLIDWMNARGYELHRLDDTVARANDEAKQD